MSDKLAQSQDTSIELSEHELDGVAGGVALSIADATGVAFGQNFAATVNSSNTQTISVPNFNLATGQAHSASIAG
ncbi:MAG: CTB family bacteriocin (plasmid) [Leptolyngbya sp. BL-A-14]